MTPVVTMETDKEPSVEDSEKKAESEPLAPPPEITTTAAAEPLPSEPLPSAQSDPVETKQEAES